MHVKISDVSRSIVGNSTLGLPKISTMNHSCLTIVVKSVCDLMSDDHSYSTEVKGLVLMFAEERRLQDSRWKH